jgi:hypothetical protein
MYQADLDALIAKRGSVTFRSWDGEWQGTDNDTDLTFLPNGVAHMLEYGDGIDSYAGTYAVGPDGAVTATFAKFPGGWPPMSLRKDATSLLVFPKDEKVGFVMGGRGGATVLGGRASFWPFRPIPEGEEAAHRERIKKWHRD